MLRGVDIVKHLDQVSDIQTLKNIQEPKLLIMKVQYFFGFF